VNKETKDLTKEAPRSPHEKLGGYVILARSIDKCRATLAGKNGEYHYDCAMDWMLFGWKGIDAAALKAYVAEGRSDDEILAWISSHGTPKTAAEIAAWSADRTAYNMSDVAEKKAWLEGENKRFGLGKDGTLFDYLDADDRASFKK
jgi:hypothetical protein